MINIEDIIKSKDLLVSQGKSLDIDSIFIEQQGQLSTHYFKTAQPHNIRSCSKLLVAYAVGIAIERQLILNKSPITLDSSIFPALQDVVEISNVQNITKIEQWTVRNLLTHTTGYESQMMSERFIKNIDKNKLLEYALNFDIPFEPTTHYAYNNVEPYIFAVIFKEAFNVDLDVFIDEHIFSKLGITNFTWGKYGKYCKASTGLSLSHEDYHKIGQLLLNKGQYNGIQIVPEKWITEMCSLKIETPQYYKPERVFPKCGIGYYTFISKDGFIFRDGGYGQYIIVNPERKLLITILSSDKEMQFVTEPLRELI